MKKKLLVFLCAALTLSCTACDNSAKETAEFEKNYGKVTLCDYKNLEVEKEISTVTDEQVAESIENMLYDYAETKEVTRPSKENDILTVEMTAKKDGENFLEYAEEDAYSFYLGYQEFGEEFDTKLTNVSTGAELTFSVTYKADFEIPDFAGATIEYAVKVLKIEEEILPELTDEFITNTLEYASREDMENSIRQQIKEDNETNSEYYLREDLITQVVDNSTFESYSQELYDKFAELIEEGYLGYAQMFGYETVEEIYEAFGMTEEAVEEEILDAVYRNIAVEAIARKEKISVSDEEFESKQNALMEEYAYESLEDLYNDYGEEDTIRLQFLEEEVLDFLQNNAKITEVEVSGEDELSEEDNSEAVSDDASDDVSDAASDEASTEA